MSSLLGGDALTNMAVGAVGQLDNNWTNSNNQEAALMKQRQSLVDKVAAEQDLMSKQADDIARTQNSYVQTYGIDPDMAYAIATNPNAKNMKLDELGDYINSLKPTGQSTPYQPAHQGQPIAPGISQNRGAIGTALNGPGANVPPVQGVYYPEQPSRQIYKPDQSYIPQSQRISMVRDAMTAAKGDPTTARQLLESMHQGAGSWLPPNMKAPECKAAAAADRVSRREALTKIYSMVGSGELPPEAAPGVLASYGIDPKTVNLGVLSNLAKTKQDPVKQQQINDMVPNIEAHFNELNTAQATSLAQAVVSGQLVLKQGPDGGTYLIDFWDPQHPITDQNDVKRLINSMQATAQKRGDIPGPQGNQTGANQSQMPYPDLGTRQDFEKVQDGIQYVPGGVNKNLSKPVSDDINKAMLPVPSMLRTMGQLQAAANNDPNGLGMYGAATRYFGGPAVGLLNGIDRKSGDSLNNLLGVSNKANLRAMEEGFKSAYNMPNVRSYMLQGSAMGGGGGGLSNPRDIDQWFDGEHITSNIQSFNAELNAMKSNLYRNYANYFNQVYNVPNDLNSNIKSVELMDKYLVRQGFAEPDARAIVEQLGAIQSGGKGQ